ncbi:hypothetical protein Pst134EA_009092 [Puccinia striiformis f. sp. tritici]|uniref:hypothetical protein n=1 Tax=Puccinia striiformis f. sp. tritici TaxID=168172 RepID=UPI002007F7FB|nr:hypothetical protein Pst134EA_009092 [Puccinia striiformis f. sp. tritici]KAH9468554.1 hypothetical protein Pst134EA_009092 [Puccinia striiformis f. sp. tritici]
MPSLHGVKNHRQHQSLVLNTLNRRPFQSFRLQTDHHPADTSSDSRDGLLEGAEQNTEDDGVNFVDEAFYPQNHADANHRGYEDDDDESMEGWDSIPWTIRGNPTRRSQPLDSILSQEVRTANQSNIANSLQHQWDLIMPRLFAVYLWLKSQTKNWTTDNSFVSFVPTFCSCPRDAQKTSQWIDCVDIVGQERRQFLFCKCMPRAIHLLANGFLCSSPTQPTTGFSMRLMHHHNYAWQLCNVRNLPFSEVQRRFGEERSFILWDKKGVSGRELRNCLSSVIVVYRELLERNKALVKAALGLEGQRSLANDCCPACFGPSSATGDQSNPKVNHRLVPSDLDNMKRHIAELEVIHKVSRSKKTPDKCADSHKAADDTRNETTWKGCDDTGLMGSCCRHNGVIYLANIVETGENRALPLSILKRLLQNIDPNRPVGVLYDIGCSLDKFIEKDRSRLFFGTAVFHAFVHDWPCQLSYNPRYNDGWGLSDGDAMERLWSSLSPQVSPLRYATRNNRLGALAHRCKFRNKEGILGLAAWLRQKFLNALRKRDAAKKELKEIFHTLKPYEEGHINYSKDFLRAQWEKQTRCESQRAEDDELRMKQLAEFFRNEEVLDKTKKDIFGVRHRLPRCVEDWHDIVTIFENHEVKQQELAVLLGRDYQELLGATVDKEKMLALLWEAKSQLFSQAVQLQGERHPIMGSQTVGTRIQQRILKAITRRKSPVDKAIKEFNKRRSTYLAAYEPTRLKLPENKELGYKAFLKMDLNDPFWNDGFFFHSRDPWAVDSTVRSGIMAMLMMDRVQEEVQILSQELDLNLIDTLLRLSPEQIDYNNPENRLAAIPILLPITIKLGVMRYELQTCLKNHEQLMSVWISDIDWLWESTRNQHTKSTHPWFESVSFLRGRRYHNTLNGIDDAMEQLNFAEGQANEPDVESSDEENSEGGE